MGEHRAVVERFYAALARRDAEDMAACYADDAVFTDPIFGELRGEAVREMWRMLLGRSSGGMTVSVTFLGGAVDGTTEQVLAVIDYTFSRTGKRVRNTIATFMKFSDGRIAQQIDDFNFYAWARQAFGVMGWVAGWMPAFRAKVGAEAAAALARFRVTPTRAA
jgi:ketosteroid isomerase-like protein